MKYFLILLLGSLTAFAEEKDPRPDMHALAAEISGMQKYIFSEADFSAPANDAKIKESIDTLDTHLSHLSKGTFEGDPVLQVNLGLLQQHIKDAKRSFAEGQKPFARYMLQSSLQMCIACHTRRKAADFSWPEVDAKNIPLIDKGDYLFATRQFSKGRQVYEELVQGYPENKAGVWNLQKALLAMAVYFSRVTEDPAGGAVYFSKVGANEKIPAYQREELKAWAKEFAAWAKEKPQKAEKLTESQLLAQAKKLLRHDDFSLVSELERSFHVRRLRAASLLQQLLESPGGFSPMKGEALLYLGQIYSRISSNLFFRFGEMYLKACITGYPKTQISRSCYVALESVVTEGYSGSGGTNIPDDEQIELMRLKKLAY
ncbi:MAG: hypothetical protein ACXWQO_08730 [Bdellovibrionota bacterium]